MLKISPTGIQSPDGTARSESLKRLRYPGPQKSLLKHQNKFHISRDVGIFLFRGISEFLLIYSDFPRNPRMIFCGAPGRETQWYAVELGNGPRLLGRLDRSLAVSPTALYQVSCVNSGDVITHVSHTLSL